MTYGTLSTLDVFESVNQTVLEFGENNAWDAISIALAAFARQSTGMAGLLWDITTDTRRVYGAGDTKVMEEVDQFGAPSAQKISAGITLDLPLRRYVQGIQWSRQAFEMMAVSQLMAEANEAARSALQNVIRAAKVALFSSANYTFTDQLGRPAGVALAVKALVNNDGTGLPVGPNGETFATSHTHYLANATLTAAAVTSLIVTVQEHFNSGLPLLIISQTDEAAFRALTGFIADVDVRITQPNTATYTTTPLTVPDLYNRRIGLFGAAEVWIKPWAIANYALCLMQGAPPPLAMRKPLFGPAGDFRLVSQNEGYPLRSQMFEHQFGFGVANRVSAAILYFASGSYVVPTIT